MPDSQPQKKKRVALVWLWNFLVPGLGVGTIYACGTGALGILFWFWVLELFLTRLDVVLFASAAMSVWGTIEVTRQNHAIEFEENLDVVATLPGTMASVDNLIDKVSKGLVSAIEDGDSIYALDTLERKAREAELRLKSIDEKLNTRSKAQGDENTGDSLAAELPESLGLVQSPGSEYCFDKQPDAVIGGEVSSGLMSFAPLFETVEDGEGLSLPLGKEPEPLSSTRSSLSSGANQSLFFSPPAEEVNPNEEAIRAWLDTGGGASQSNSVEEAASGEDTCSDFDGVSANLESVSAIVEAESLEIQREPSVLFDTAGAEFAPLDVVSDEHSFDAGASDFEPLSEVSESEPVVEVFTDFVQASMQPGVALEPAEPSEQASPAVAAPPGSEFREPVDSSKLSVDGESSFLRESSSVLDNTSSTAVFESSPQEGFDDIPATLFVAGLDTPFATSATFDSPAAPSGNGPSFEASSSTGFFNFLSEEDREVTEFVDKLANTIGSATSPQPAIDSSFEFSIPNFESSFSFDFSNALSDVAAEKDSAGTASKGSRHCQRCGSDRQSEFSFCLKCGISFPT